jgi:curved DNA-binding protein CbpA
MNYFQGLTTVEEIKATYKKLAFQHHPDLGGDTETMKIINNQYEAALKSCDGQKSYDSEGKEHFYRYNEVTEREIIEFLHKFFALNLPLESALIGTWFWITGDTKPHKESLKEIKCQWHSKRGCWYFRPASSKSWAKGQGGSLEQLACKYGVTDLEQFKGKAKPKAAKKAIGS